jgi:hypothetical protein
VGCYYCRREECNRQRCSSAGSCILAGGAGGESQSENQASPYPYLSGLAMSLWFVYSKIEYVGHLPDDAYMPHTLASKFFKRVVGQGTMVDAFIMTRGDGIRLLAHGLASRGCLVASPLHLLFPLSSTLPDLWPDDLTEVP